MWTRQPQAASLIVIEVKQEIAVDLLTTWVDGVSFSVDEFDHINIVTVFQFLFWTLCEFGLFGYELPEHLQAEDIITWIILFISVPLAILDDHNFLVFHLFVEVITTERVQYPVKCLL